jgi:hypothetical protein
VKSDYMKDERINVKNRARISKICRRGKYISFLKVNIFLRLEHLTAIMTTILGLCNEFRAQFKHTFLPFKNVFCIIVTIVLLV